MHINHCLPGIMVITPSKRVGIIDKHIKDPHGRRTDRVEVRYIDADGALVTLRPDLLERYTDSVPRRHT